VGKGTESKGRVLIVEDEEKIINFIRLKLGLSGYEVIGAANGKEALDLARTAKPDVVVLDILMPVMDGFEVLKQLRTFSNVPVIVATAKEFTSDKALSLGANDYMLKPFKPDELMRKIENILNKR
jgi:two-component system KDP operon response regulator KdpE